MRESAEFNTRTALSRSGVKSGSIYPEFEQLTITQRRALVDDFRAGDYATLAEMLVAQWVDRYCEQVRHAQSG